MKKVKLVCGDCGESFSTSLGDYFWMSESDHFSHCGRQKSQVIILQEDDVEVTRDSKNRVIKTVSTWVETVLMFAPTKGDLRKALQEHDPKEL